MQPLFGFYSPGPIDLDQLPARLFAPTSLGSNLTVCAIIPAGVEVEQRCQQKEQQSQSAKRDGQVPARRPVPEPDVNLARGVNPHTPEDAVDSKHGRLPTVDLRVPTIDEAVDYCEDAGQIGTVLDPDFIRRNVKLAQRAGGLCRVRIGLGSRLGLGAPVRSSLAI